MEDTIAEGSQGIDAAFRKLHGVAEPVKYSPVPEVVQTQEAAPGITEPPPPQEVPVKRWEIVASDGRLMESNGSICHYVWRFVVRNNSDVDITFSGDVDFVDADDHSVDVAKVTVVRIAPHADQEFSGSKMMMIESAQACWLFAKIAPSRPSDGNGFQIVSTGCPCGAVTNRPTANKRGPSNR